LDFLFVCVRLVLSTATISVSFSFAERSTPDRAVEPPGSEDTIARLTIANDSSKLYVSGWKGERLVSMQARNMRVIQWMYTLQKGDTTAELAC
jgi:hypothetical protein